MNIRIIFLLSAFAAFFLPFAYGENNPAPAAAQATAAARRGALYRVRQQGHTAYVFGTIHVGLPAFFPLDDQVTQALSHASRLVLELDVRRDEPFQAALRKHGLYADGDTLERHLSPAGLAHLRRALERFGMPFAQVTMLKPWLVTNMLVGLDLERQGYQRRYGIEFFLLAQAQAKEVRELESAEYQMSLYDDMSDAQQEQYLRENLAELEESASRGKARALIEAWASADGDAQERLLRESLAEKTLSADFTQRVLLDKRNPEMADKIGALLQSGETSFVAIGLLHVLGENGVPALLRRRGYEVEKLY
ncbi:TraB/GumN family protein [Noviherbaspirillum sp. UKPF54]|uniref:TraB/GumN family protein n=1 Tax=Noviherbaspirillum sp. UKPF54 TaxID=2601898 RepID=UPI0011B1B27B|nr:TraB/GumN family protein [Noviherbaspirillum sp. UKPF54]QDZ29167.1 TraB/GumN family protein [Noviherbaspirillum sp. UKPF54]